MIRTYQNIAGESLTDPKFSIFCTSYCWVFCASYSPLNKYLLFKANTVNNNMTHFDREQKQKSFLPVNLKINKFQKFWFIHLRTLISSIKICNYPNNWFVAFWIEFHFMNFGTLFIFFKFETVLGPGKGNVEFLKVLTQLFIA